MGKLVPNTRIVFLSQEIAPAIVNAAFQVGADAYVFKFDAANDLITAIHAVVRGEKFVSRSLIGSWCTNAQCST